MADRHPGHLGQPRHRAVGGRSSSGRTSNAHIPGYLGGSGEPARASTICSSAWTSLGVATGVLTPGLTRTGVEQALEVADAHPGRFLVAAMIADPTQADPQRHPPPRPRVSTRASAWCGSRRCSPRCRSTTRSTTPCTQVCEELGLPVAINVGVPGPRVRSRVQHPELLEDVMIDFPDAHDHRRAHGPPLRGAAHELHAQVGPTSTSRAPPTRRATWTRTWWRS